MLCFWQQKIATYSKIFVIWQFADLKRNMVGRGTIA
jgi:hypothetical protein